MNIINIEHISKIFGEKVIYEDASFGVQQGDKVDGLVPGEQADHLGVDAAVLGGVEHLGPDHLDQVGQHLRLEQHRAQHALLGLHTVGRLDAHALEIQFMAAIAAAAAFFGHTRPPFHASRKSAPFHAGSAAAAERLRPARPPR